MNDPNSRNQEIHEAPQTRYGRPADPRQAAMDEFVVIQHYKENYSHYIFTYFFLVYRDFFFKELSFFSG